MEPPLLKKTEEPGFHSSSTTHTLDPSSLPAMKIVSKILPYLLLALLLCFPFFALSCSTPEGGVERLEKATVLKVVDGDTLQIEFRNEKVNVRLIGIDTPESRANSKAKKDAQRTGEDLRTILRMGKQAAAFTRQRVQLGDTVRVEFDVQPRDRYGRLLAYIWLPNGRMLNEEIVEAGYAGLMTYPPNVKYQERFLAAYQKARSAGSGLWKG